MRRFVLPLAAVLSISPFVLTACGSSQASSSEAPPITIPAGAHVVARDAHVSGEIAALNGQVYWVDRGESIVDSIHVAPATGGEGQLFYSADPSSAAIEDLAVDTANVYWIEVASDTNWASKIKSMPQTAGTPRVLYSSATQPFGSIAAGGGSVYSLAISLLIGGDLVRVPSAGGPSMSLAAAADLVVANDEAGCWVEVESDPSGSGSPPVRVRCQRSGSDEKKTLVSQSQPIWSLAMNASLAAWATPNDANDHSSLMTLHETPIAGGPSVTLSEMFSSIVALQMDEASLYALVKTGSSNSIVKMPLNGGEPVTLVDGLFPDAETDTQNVELALDAASVFWTDTKQGVVFSIAK
jgi:hypothetical protein